jgi:hypothetical protein
MTDGGGLERPPISLSLAINQLSSLSLSFSLSLFLSLAVGTTRGCSSPIFKGGGAGTLVVLLEGHIEIGTQNI